MRVHILGICGTFMGGMCLGSLLLSKYVTRSEHPLRVYALLELGIGVFGVLIPLVLPHVGGLYTAIGGSGMGGIVMRAIFCAIVLIIPTIMMGATLPAIARYVEATPQGVSWLGFFYGGNIFGAVGGSLLAGARGERRTGERRDREARDGNRDQQRSLEVVPPALRPDGQQYPCAGRPAKHGVGGGLPARVGQQPHRPWRVARALRGALAQRGFRICAPFPGSLPGARTATC